MCVCECVCVCVCECVFVVSVCLRVHVHVCVYMCLCVHVKEIFLQKLLPSWREFLADDCNLFISQCIMTVSQITHTSPVLYTCTYNRVVVGLIVLARTTYLITC